MDLRLVFTRQRTSQPFALPEASDLTGFSVSRPSFSDSRMRKEEISVCRFGAAMFTARDARPLACEVAPHTENELTVESVERSSQTGRSILTEKM